MLVTQGLACIPTSKHPSAYFTSIRCEQETLSKGFSMKQLFFLISAMLVFIPNVRSQDIVKQAPPGFDSVRAVLLTEKSIRYITNQKQLALNVKRLFILLRHIQRIKSIPCYIFCMALAATKRNGLNGGHPQVILDNLYAENKIEPMIVVMPNGRAMKDDRAVGNIFDCIKVQAFSTFEKDLLNDLIPFIEKTLPGL